MHMSLFHKIQKPFDLGYIIIHKGAKKLRIGDIHLLTL
jgi:hypothetical protein